MRVVPKQQPGKSKQDYQTPPEFLEAVKARLQIKDFGWDLAASDENCVSPYGYYDEATNSLTAADWQSKTPETLWQWLNPPYADIKPWVKKCAEESLKGAHIACLVPASTGANWWKEHVTNDAYVLFLNGRITFVGATAPYPKDCALLLYTPFIRKGSDIWTWKPSTQISSTISKLSSLPASTSTSTACPTSL